MDAATRKWPRLVAVPPRTRDGLGDLGDDELMMLARAGRRAAFELLVTRHQLRALRVATRYLNDVCLARDVAQNAFLELYRNLDRYQSRGRFTAYLYRIVINQCRMAARSRRATVCSLENLELAHEMGAEAVLLRVQCRDLQHALSRLSEKLRLVVILRYSEDLDLTEVADMLDLPLGTVKRRLFDAMGKLRQALEGES